VRREAAYGSSSKVQAGSGRAARALLSKVYVSRGVHIRDVHPNRGITAREVPPGRRSVNPSGVGLRPRSRVTAHHPGDELLGMSGCAGCAGFVAARCSRRSRNLLAHSARVGGAVTEGKPRSG
jgi:hypothetical protein